MTGQDEREVDALTRLRSFAESLGALDDPPRYETSDADSYFIHEELLDIAEGFHLTPTAVLEDAGPEAGHTFEVSVRSRGSAGVLGGPKSDANWWGDPSVVRVRAWNLPDAVAMASTIPYHKWESAPTAEVKAEALCPNCGPLIPGTPVAPCMNRAAIATHLREKGETE